MNKYIGENRLTYLWGKIKAFVSNAISGKVDKVSSSTDNAVVRFDGTNGAIQNSGVTINDSNHLTAAKLITSGGTSSQFVKGDGSLDNNAYAGAQTSGGAANKAVSIPFGQVDSTSTSTAFTATVDGITELRDGVCVYLKNGVVTSASGYTININNLGAKPVYQTMAAATASTTGFNINYTMLFVYNSSRVAGGCWDMFYGYYYNIDVQGYDIREYNSGSKKVKTACQRYQIILTCMDGMLLPVYSGAYSNGTSKTLTTEKFNPLGQIYYYYSTTNLSAGGSPAAGTLVSQFTYNTVDIRYSFNTGSTLTVGNDIYLVCVPQDDGSAVLHTSPIAFSLPSTEDGLIYKRLGKAYSTYTIALEQDKPCYYYKNGSINLWTGTGTQTDVSKSTESNVIDVAEYDLMKINEVKGNSLVMNQRVKNPNPSTTNNTEWSAYNNSNVSKEYVDDGVKATILNEGYGYSRGIAVNCTRITNTHKYLAIITIKPSVTHDFSFETGNGQATNTSCTANQWTKVIGIVTAYRDGTQLIVKPATSNLSVNDTFTVRFASCIDLTQMFGEGNEPTTVEEVEAILGNDYYEYNTGEVVGNNVEKLDVTGFNIWDEEWEVGGYNYYGVKNVHNDRIRIKNPIRVLPKVTYYIKSSSSLSNGIVVLDNNRNFVSNLGSNVNREFIIPENGSFIVFSMPVEYGTTYNNDICINKSNTSKNGTYEPYKHNELSLNLTELTGKVNGEGTSVTIFPDGLHGVGTAYDSLIVDDDGYARKAVKRMGSVDLGSLSWDYMGTAAKGFYTAAIFKASMNLRCYMYTSVSGETIYGGTASDMTIGFSSNGRLRVRNDAYSTAADFKTAMSSVMLYYELATPIEYVLDTPVQCVAKVYPNGTVKQVPVMPDSTPMVMDVTYLRDNALYATKEYVKDAIADKADSATTLAGYGITDAKIENGVITLGSNSVTPITSHQDISGKADKSELLPEAIDYSKQYLRTTALESGTISFNIWKSMGTDMITSISYSLDNGVTWVTTANQDNKQNNLSITVNVSEGDSILWKGIAQQMGYYAEDAHDYVGSFFSSDCEFDVQGNVMSLCYGDNFIGQTTLNYAGQFASLFSDYSGNLKCSVVNTKDLSLSANTLAQLCYYSMFYGCTSLTTAPELPATTLTDSCYSYMFEGCTALTTAPELPATTLAQECYSYMFEGCTALTSTLVLSATTLADFCYSDMFNGCTSLVTAPELPATTLANSCYNYMFSGCTSLTIAPSTLPATTLANRCYYSMFNGCTSLTSAPVLSATTLVYQCYQGMFSGCSNLNYIKALFTTTPSTTYTQNWVSGVAASGTFVKNDSATWTTTGNNAVPNGWTVRTESEMEPVRQYQLNDRLASLEARIAALEGG